jgi:DNA modification methylase
MNIIPTKLNGDARQLLAQMPFDTFHCCITSPPYHGMRSYLPADHPWKHLEIGSEPTVELYIQHLIEVFNEVHRVMRFDGTLWVNMGDRYTSSGRATYEGGGKYGAVRNHRSEGVRRPADPEGLARKELCMMPARVAMALQQNGWFLRAMCPWIKRNSMPESIQDRPAVATEYWFMFSKKERYYYDRHAVTIDSSKNTHPRAAVFPHRDTRDEERGRRRLVPTPKAAMNAEGARANEDFESHLDHLVSKRNRRNTDWFMESWQGMLQDSDGNPMAFIVNPKGTNLEHFASYPPKLIEPIIRSCTSEAGCCMMCGAPRRRMVKKGEPDRAHQQACGGNELGIYEGQAKKDYEANGVQDASAVKSRILAGMVEYHTIGWMRTCKCPNPMANVIPAHVLDPFGGTGCTAMKCVELGRHATSIELNPEYFKQSDVRDGQGALAIIDGTTTNQ